MTIGQAVARLSADFPGLRAETLRVLEEHGLVAPERTSAGYRRYSERDLDRVRRALSGPPAPRAEPAPPPGPEPEPYPVWRGPGTEPVVPTPEPEPEPEPEPYPVWAGPGRTEPVTAPAAAVAPSAAATPPAAPDAAEEALSASSQGAARRRAGRWPEPEYFTPELGEVALGREGLARASGLGEEWLAELAAHGLISGRDPASGGDLLVARAAAELLGHGIEPRHLRPVHAAAGRAAALITAASGGSSRSGTAQAAAALVRLEAALLRAALLDD